MPYLQEQYGNPSSVYALGRRAHSALDAAREQMRRALNAAQAREIFFTSCGTESDNWAIFGVAHALRGKGKHIITTAAEHHAVLDSCKALEKEGYELTYLPVDAYGQVQADQVRAALRKIQFLSARSLQIMRLGQLTLWQKWPGRRTKRGRCFIQMRCRLSGMCRWMCRSWRWICSRCPGISSMRQREWGRCILERELRLINICMAALRSAGGAQGTENLASIVGMGKAAELAVQELPQEMPRLTALREEMIALIKKWIPGVCINGHPVQRLPGNINLSLPVLTSEAALYNLDMAGIACSSGSACTAGSLDPSHVLMAMGLSQKQARGALRFTFSRDTTQEEVRQTAQVLADIAGRLQNKN